MAELGLFRFFANAQNILFIVFCLWISISVPIYAAPIPTKQIVLNVPQGYTDHNNSRLFCIDPSPWTHIAIFYLGNYAAHAATLVTYPGEAPFNVVRGILYALFFPTSGIVRGLNSIFRRATFTKNDLDAATRAGALCMVVRTHKWKPLGYVEPPENQEDDVNDNGDDEDKKSDSQ
jgi:hypothetical protein